VAAVHEHPVPSEVSFGHHTIALVGRGTYFWCVGFLVLLMVPLPDGFVKLRIDSHFTYLCRVQLQLCLSINKHYLRCRSSKKIKTDAYSLAFRLSIGVGGKEKLTEVPVLTLGFTGNHLVLLLQTTPRKRLVAQAKNK